MSVMTKGRIAREVLVWLVSLFLALVCLRSGLQKVMGNVFWVRDFQRWGYPGWFRLAVGAAELASLVLLLIPRLASLGAGLFVIVMSGAIYTHATHNESSRLPFNFLLLLLSLLVLFARRVDFLRNFTSGRA